MQKIVSFIELNEDAFVTPLKIGNLFMNRSRGFGYSKLNKTQKLE